LIALVSQDSLKVLLFKKKPKNVLHAELSPENPKTSIGFVLLLAQPMRDSIGPRKYSAKGLLILHVFLV